jgi:4-amino-4-deoxy-L-arabinose transferase-like glycosyltransferase
MLPLLPWGLPSSAADNLLFGGAPAWSAARYNAATDLAQLSTRPAGADTDLNPLVARDRLIDLTTDDGARAEILRRYRLYSRQPDEMIIFRALQRMHPRQLDFDPRLYQYGGGYIYLVGAALGVGALLHYVPLTADIGVYLEHPELFARFYVVARLLSLLFGALTLWAVFRLARRAGGRRAAWIAVAAVACTPVFITAVLEAKPHLPSACLILWATLSALAYRDHGRPRHVLLMGVRAGYAFGLVLTGALAALLWPALYLACPPQQRRRALWHLALAGAVALAVYVVTNPYVPYNWLANRAALASNITNSTAMYRGQMARAFDGAANVAYLLYEGAGILPIFGLIGLALLWRRYPAATLLASAAGVSMLLLDVLLGAGKPAEFARFLILPVLLLCIAAACWLRHWTRRPLLRTSLVAAVMLGTAARGAFYTRAFCIDAYSTSESRHAAADFLRTTLLPEDSVAVIQEPAPYAVPPLDFTRRKIVLLPQSSPVDESAALPQWLVLTADHDRVHKDAWWQRHYTLVARFPTLSETLTPITWAHKATYVYERRH